MLVESCLYCIYCFMIQRTKPPRLPHSLSCRYEVAPRSDSEESDSDYEEEVCTPLCLGFIGLKVYEGGACVLPSRLLPMLTFGWWLGWGFAKALMGHTSPCSDLRGSQATELWRVLNLFGSKKEKLAFNWKRWNGLLGRTNDRSLWESQSHASRRFSRRARCLKTSGKPGTLDKKDSMGLVSWVHYSSGFPFK